MNVLSEAAHIFGKCLRGIYIYTLLLDIKFASSICGLDYPSIAVVLMQCDRGSLEEFGSSYFDFNSLVPFIYYYTCNDVKRHISKVLCTTYVTANILHRMFFISIFGSV